MDEGPLRVEFGLGYQIRVIGIGIAYVAGLVTLCGNGDLKESLCFNGFCAVLRI